MAIEGIVDLRAHQLGRQALFGTPVAAQRRYPFSGVPDINRNWTDPEGDFGAIDLIAPPVPQIPDFTAPLTAPVVNYNDLIAMLAGVLGGGVTPTGAGTEKIWHFAPSSLTPDEFDVFTYEFGDDVTSDWDQLSDGIITELSIEGPTEGAGAMSASMSWVFAEAASTGATDHPVTGTVPTPSLAIDTLAIPVYLQDASVFIDSDPGNLGDTQLLDTVHSFGLKITQATDQKRYVNGTQSFALQAYGRGKRLIEMTVVGAKTSDWVGTGSEKDAWWADAAVPRYMRVSFESLAMADDPIPYSWLFDLPLRWYTSADGELGSNSTVTLVGRAFYDPDEDIEFAFDTTVTNTLASTDL